MLEVRRWGGNQFLQPCLKIILCGLMILSVVVAPVASADATTPVNAAVGSTGDESSMTAQVDEVAASDLSGSGTAEDPYRISTVSELQAMETELDASYVLINDIDASATAQANAGQGFEPIGGSLFNSSTPDPFVGSLNGNNHTITGLTVDRPNQNYVGLFGATAGTVSNVILRNATVIGGDSVGVLTGNNQELITNVRVSGSINASEEVGGLVGENGGTVTNASASGSVNAGEDVGGLVGDNSGTVTNAGASGSVNASEEAGGLAGENSGTVTNARASSDVNGSDESVFIGGLVGHDYGILTDVSASGRVTGSYQVGGLIGGNTGPLTNATASGRVTGSYEVGGLIGDNGGSTANGTIVDASASGSVNGGDQVGGLVGADEGNGTIQNAFATGRVTGNSSLGGLVGAIETNSTPTITDAYWDTQGTGQPTSAGTATGLITAEMQGNAARENMPGLEFEDRWQTVSEDYPELIVLSDTTAGSAPSPTPTPTPPAFEPALAATVQQSGISGGTAKIEYTLSNVSEDSSVVLEFTNLPGQLSLNTSASRDRSGDFDLGGQQVVFSQPSDEVTVTVAYDVDASATTGTTFTVTAEVLDENRVTTDTTMSLIEINQKNDLSSPRDRAIQVTDVDDPTNITQNDVTAAITRFNRDQSTNGIDINQDDVTAIITLFERT